MAYRPELRRHSDGVLICDRFKEWEGWQEATGISETELLIGNVFHYDKVGNTSYSTTVKMRFSEGPFQGTGGLWNLQQLRNLREAMGEARFKDPEGEWWIVDLGSDVSAEPVSGSRMRTAYTVSMLLRRKREWS